MRKLLDAAMIVFARRGYYAARVDDIVKVARTSHGTFYLYFSNKEDLLRALVAEAGEVVADLDTALGPWDPTTRAGVKLRRWMEHFSEAWQRYAPVLRAWTDLAMSDVELSAQGHAAAGAVAQTLASRIAETGPQPGIDPNAAAEAVVAMVDRFHYLRQFAGEPVDAAALDTLTTMVHRALFAGGHRHWSTWRAAARRRCSRRSGVPPTGPGRRGLTDAYRRVSPSPATAIRRGRRHFVHVPIHDGHREAPPPPTTGRRPAGSRRWRRPPRPTSLRPRPPAWRGA